LKGNISLVGALGCMLLGGIWIHQHQEIVVASLIWERTIKTIKAFVELQNVIFVIQQ